MEIRSIKVRLTALRNIPRFLKLVYETSPSLTIYNLFTRLILALVPVAMLYVGKLLIDQVVFLSTNGNRDSSQADLWKYVAIEGFLMVLINALNKLVVYLDGLLGDLYANHTSVKIMTKAAKLDLEQFEDSEFYDKFKRARIQT